MTAGALMKSTMLDGHYLRMCASTRRLSFRLVKVTAGIRSENRIRSYLSPGIDAGLSCFENWRLTDAKGRQKQITRASRNERPNTSPKVTKIRASQRRKQKAALMPK